jgi:hypothetical protein
MDFYLHTPTLLHGYLSIEKILPYESHNPEEIFWELGLLVADMFALN